MDKIKFVQDLYRISKDDVQNFNNFDLLVAEHSDVIDVFYTFLLYITEGLSEPLSSVKILPMDFSRFDKSNPSFQFILLDQNVKMYGDIYINNIHFTVQNTGSIYTIKFKKSSSA